MSERTSNIEIGSMSQVNAKTYLDQGNTLNQVKVEGERGTGVFSCSGLSLRLCLDGGRYTPKLEINANEYHYHEHRAGSSPSDSESWC